MSWVTSAYVKKWQDRYDLQVNGELPKDLVFTQKGNLFFAEKDGYVRFYWWDRSKGNNGGYGGSKFNIKLDTGNELILYGPWSSSTTTMNAAGFPHTMEAVFDGYISIYLTLVFVQQLLNEFKLPYKIKRENRQGEPYYSLTPWKREV